MRVRSGGLLVCAAALLLSASFETVAGQNEEKLFFESREDIPAAYRWNLADIFESTDAWDEAASALQARLPELEPFRGRIAESPKVLADVLDLSFELGRSFEDLFVYAGQWQRTNTRDSRANAYAGRAESLGAKLASQRAFIGAEIAVIPQEKLERFLEEPRLASYAHYIANIRRTRSHIRSGEVEEVLAASQQVRGAPAQIYQAIVSADIKWPEITDENGGKVRVVPALFYSFMANPDRRVRRDAALALFGTLDDFGNSLAATFSASVSKDIWLARTRGYGSSLEMSLDQTNVPRTVVEQLITTVHDNIDAIHDYVALRKRVLGIESFHVYDLYVGMVPDAEKHYTFDDGWRLAMEFWEDTFGDEYALVAKRALKERWIDVYQSAGKRGGAFSWGSYNSHPYLFLNWGGTLEDVFTLVHEMGHSIHTHLANAANPSHDADYGLFVAEVASVASESLFFEWLYRRVKDPREQLSLVNLRMNKVTGTFLRQIFFHEFEAAAHEAAERGQSLTKASLGKIFGDLWLRYYGDEATLDEVYRSGWARIPHFYRTFYVWKYATSFAAGEAIAARFRAGEENAVTDYLAALKLGGSVYPMEAIARTGVDLNDPEVIRTVLVRYRELVAKMRVLLDPAAVN